MEKIYTNYDEYLQDAYELQSDRYANNNVNNERTQETTRQQSEE